MNRKKATRLFENYKKSIDNGNFEQALTQSRELYSGLFRYYDEAEGKEKQIFLEGLDGLEHEAFNLILPHIKTKSRRVK